MVKHLWWAVWLALVPASLWAQASGSARPAVKVGDVAVYTVDMKGDNRVVEETVTVTAVDASQITSTHARPRLTTEGITTLELATVLAGISGSRFDPPAPNLKFPLTVGESWKGVYEVVGTNQSRGKADITYKVAGTEKITTPAGEFDTFRLESGGWVTGITWQGALRVAQIQWYAPSIGRFVKTEFKDYRGGNLWTNNLTELKSFKPAP